MDESAFWSGRNRVSTGRRTGASRRYRGPSDRPGPRSDPRSAPRSGARSGAPRRSEGEPPRGRPRSGPRPGPRPGPPRRSGPPRAPRPRSRSRSRQSSRSRGSRRSVAGSVPTPSRPPSRLPGGRRAHVGTKFNSNTRSRAAGADASSDDPLPLFVSVTHTPRSDPSVGPVYRTSHRDQAAIRRPVRPAAHRHDGTRPRPPGTRRRRVPIRASRRRSRSATRRGVC